MAEPYVDREFARVHRIANQRRRQSRLPDLVPAKRWSKRQIAQDYIDEAVEMSGLTLNRKTGR